MNENFKPDVVVVGAGYVGLTLALHLASKGQKILAVDINEDAVKKLQNGVSPIFENSIQLALKECVNSGNINFSTKAPSSGCAYWILAISYFPGDKSHYLRVLDNIKGLNEEPPTIMIRGTVPVGYLSQTILPALEQQFDSGLDSSFHLVSAPERSLSGAALEELESLPQIIGGSEESFNKAELVFNKAETNCIHLPNLEAGEIAKTFTNFARLVQFNLSNYLGTLCHHFDISEEMMLSSVKEGYPRLNYLSIPGPGVGGFCLPKDSLVLHDGISELLVEDNADKSFIDFPKHQFELNRSIIEMHANLVYQLVKNNSKVLAMGLAFKGIPQTDDLRDSVGVSIVEHLMKNNINVDVFDLTVPKEKLKSIKLSISSFPKKIDDYDAILLLNNDYAYRDFIFENIKKEGSISLYDPWRLVVTGKEKIFQHNFPKQLFGR
jgi:UDP-N-acetyl-D-mannosaminuronic acid dehydrogenase